MPRLNPQPPRVLECIIRKFGFRFLRQSGSHRAFRKSGVIRPLIIPQYEEIDTDLIARIIRQAGMTRKQYFALLKECQ